MLPLDRKHEGWQVWEQQRSSRGGEKILREATVIGGHFEDKVET